jgi:WD40 repeat protein
MGATTGVLLAAGVAFAAGPPPVLWSASNPGGLAASVGAVAWSPSGTLVASGLSERNVRIRQASNGQLLSTILQPRHSNGVVRLQFSDDSQFLAVGNATGTLQFRVYQVSSGTFLGLIVATVDSNSIVHYGVDAQLGTAPGGAGQLSRWKVSDLPVFVTTGSGYDKVTTRFQLSPDGTLETALSKSIVTVRRVSSGAVLATVAGASSAFSPNSGSLAAWTSSPNVTRLYRTTDFALIRTLTSPNSADSVQLRFTPSGTTLVASGYLPFLNPDGTWNQKGIIRFWRVSDGALLNSYDQGLSLGVTSGVAFTTDGTKLLVGVYDGTTIAATNPY